MKNYKDNILGLSIDIDLENDEAYEVWLEAKLRRYLLPDNSIKKRVLERILGIDVMKTEIGELKK